MTPGDRIPEQLLAAAARAAAPRLGVEARRERFGPRRHWTPAVGQIWRAVDGDVAALVLIVATGSDSATVAPVTVDPRAEDDASLVVSGEGTAFGVDLTVWAGLQRSIPTMVLDCPVDDIGTDIANWIIKHGPTPPGCRVGQPIPSVFSADADVRAGAEDGIAALAETPTWGVQETPDAALAAAKSTPEQLRNHLRELQARLALPLPAVLDLLDGKRPPTAEQAGVMREVLGVTPALGASPAKLVTELNQPRWRGVIRQWALRVGSNERAARPLVAYEAGVAMAMRQTGDREPSWPDRLDQWVASHGLDTEDPEE